MAIKEAVGTGTPQQPLERPVHGTRGKIRCAKAVGSRTGSIGFGANRGGYGKCDGRKCGGNPQDGQQRAAAFFAFFRSAVTSRKTECGASGSFSGLLVCAAPFALFRFPATGRHNTSARRKND